MKTGEDKLKPSPPKVFLTGKIGVGKSTIVMAVVSALKVTVGGFVTERVFAEPGEPSGGPCRGGRRVAGFAVRDLAAGVAAPIAMFDEGGIILPIPEGFETVGAESLRRHSPTPPELRAGAVGLLVMDELGFLEIGCPRFQEAVFEAIRGPLPVLGSLKEMPDSGRRNVSGSRHCSASPFLEKVKASGIRLLRVTDESRARVEIEARELLAAWVSRHPP